MSGHKHAELMKLYAQDAMETDTPWERWQFFSEPHGEWRDLRGGLAHPRWFDDTQYRRKPHVKDGELIAVFRDSLRADGFTAFNLTKEASGVMAMPENLSETRDQLDIKKKGLIKALRAVNELRADDDGKRR